MEEVLLTEYQKIKIIATQRELEVFSFCKCSRKTQRMKMSGVFRDSAQCCPLSISVAEISALECPQQMILIFTVHTLCVYLCLTLCIE